MVRMGAEAAAATEEAAAAAAAAVEAEEHSPALMGDLDVAAASASAAPAAPAASILAGNSTDDGWAGEQDEMGSSDTDPARAALAAFSPPLQLGSRPPPPLPPPPPSPPRPVQWAIPACQPGGLPSPARATSGSLRLMS